MTYGERERIYQKAIDTYGRLNQIVIAFEEMGELTKELSKNFRGVSNRDAIAEEVADVIIIMEQLCIIFAIKDDVEAWTRRKLDRLDKGLQNGLS